MANQKIHEYLIERFNIGDDDYFDVDYFDGAVYQTAKVKGSVIKALASGSVNIYNTDGSLTADRTVDGDNFGLEFQNLNFLSANVLGVTPQTDLIQISANPTNVITGTRLFTILDVIANKRRFAILKTGQVEINEVYRLPLADGTVNQVIATDGAGNLFFQTLPTEENIYNSNGTLLADRTLTGANFELLFQTMGQFIVESHKNGVDGNVIFEVRTHPTNHSFIIRDHNTNVHILACRNGAVEISDTYFLPTNAGTNGQVLTSNGAGLSNWQNLPAAPTLYNQLIQNEGLAVVPQRSILNFVGAGVNVVDDPIAAKTVVTIGEEFIPKVSGFNVSRYHIFTNGSTTSFYSGLLQGGVGGTQGSLLLSAATATKVIRTRFTSGTTSGSIAGYRGNGTDVAIGMGFHAIFTFGFGDTTFNSAAHNWIGFGSAITFQIGSTTFASSLGNIIGVGNDPSDTTLQIMHNNSSGTAIKTPLGSDFPANRTLGAAFTGMYCFELFNDFGSQDVKWRITRIDTGTVEQGIITSTDKPTSSTFLSPVVSRCNGTSTSIAAIMDVASIQIYTKY
jgi:hypothetical protein